MKKQTGVIEHSSEKKGSRNYGFDHNNHSWLKVTYGN